MMKFNVQFMHNDLPFAVIPFWTSVILTGISGQFSRQANSHDNQMTIFKVDTVFYLKDWRDTILILNKFGIVVL